MRIIELSTKAALCAYISLGIKYGNKKASFKTCVQSFPLANIWLVLNPFAFFWDL